MICLHHLPIKNPFYRIMRIIVVSQKVLSLVDIVQNFPEMNLELSITDTKRLFLWLLGYEQIVMMDSGANR